MQATPPMTPERARAIAATFDLRALPPDFYADPFPVYAALRANEPVRRMPDGSWFLTRYADRVEVSSDAALMNSAAQVANDAPAIRADKVEAARKALANGSLGADAGKLAEALIDHMMDDKK